MSPGLAILALDLVLGFMAVEAFVLFWRKQTGAAGAVIDVACMLAPGALLVAAARSALAGAEPAVVLLLVTLALPFHLADLKRRG
jgi:hypothetical protein